MFCNGICIICSNPCFRGEVKGKQEEISSKSPFSPEEEKGVSEAFDTVNAVQVDEPLQTEPAETGLAVVEKIESYEVKKNIFGKEKVRKVKNGTV